MRSNIPYSVIVISILLFTVTGCRRSPVPIINPPDLETSLASTALALAKQTEAAQSFTATPLPSETPTPTPRISINGTSLAIRGDKSTLFSDHKLGYQLTIPPGWLPIRINEDEYYKAFTLDAVAGNQSMINFLTKVATLDPDHVRLTALDIQPEQYAKGNISGISVTLQPETAKILEEWSRAHPARANGRPGNVLLSSESQETESGIRILIREQQWRSTTNDKIYSRRIFFMIPSGVMNIDFETPFDSKDALLPELEQVIESITLLDT
ncbi:MAG: hypothetical protein ACM3XO_09850 [Bacteroidota bacterium]